MMPIAAPLVGKPSKVYIIDFGLAKKYRNPETLEHGPGPQVTGAHDPVDPGKSHLSGRTGKTRTSRARQDMPP